MSIIGQFCDCAIIIVDCLNGEDVNAEQNITINFCYIRVFCLNNVPPCVLSVDTLCAIIVLKNVFCTIIALVIVLSTLHLTLFC